MAYRLIWSPKALFDLQEVHDYISADDPKAALKFTHRIFEITERLGNFPESGRVVPEAKNPAIREIICPPCRIIYRVCDKDMRIDIVRVWHATRGIPEA